MAFEDLEVVVDDAVIDALGNADVSINGAPAVRGVFTAPGAQPFGMVDAVAPGVSVSAAAAEGVERDAEVLINGSKLYRVIGIEPEGGLVTLRLAA